MCVLPLTPQTEGVLNRDVFNAMPRGSYIINIARGGHIVDADLLDALDTGKVERAVLDVFHTEPLPAEHPFWAHPRVTLTPHIASVIVMQVAILHKSKCDTFCKLARARAMKFAYLQNQTRQIAGSRM